jgi:surfeit locus 1 family protein
MILIGLGTWQYQRLQWKTAYLAEVEQAVTAEPFESLIDVEHALHLQEPVDFRRIRFKGTILEAQTPYLVYSRRKSNLSWRRFFPVQQDSRVVFIGDGLVLDKYRDDVPQTMAATIDVAGYVRVWQPKDRGVPNSSPEANRWFSFNPMPDSHDWADSVAGGVETRYYIDNVNVSPDGLFMDTLPIKRPNIRNNHFDYMLTWYGLAVALFVIYLILHVQRGRLGFKSD